jgi:hypothetical protein
MPSLPLRATYFWWTGATACCGDTQTILQAQRPKAPEFHLHARGEAPQPAERLGEKLGPHALVAALAHLRGFFFSHLLHVL